MSVHIYESGKQPLTNYTIDVTDAVPPFHVTIPPDSEFRCDICWRLRPASELVVQVYYDCQIITCRDKEYGRRPEFPFDYTHVCVGTAYKPRKKTEATS
jgi:hypothetical protein